MKIVLKLEKYHIPDFLPPSWPLPYFRLAFTCCLALSAPSVMFPKLSFPLRV